MHSRWAGMASSAAILAATLVAISSPAQAQGSQSEMFRRHFWRGQAYHGTGYPAQVGERAPASAGALAGDEALQATVEPGTRGAAIVECAVRFQSYDSASNTHVGRAGWRYRCPGT